MPRIRKQPITHSLIPLIHNGCTVILDKYMARGLLTMDLIRYCPACFCYHKVGTDTQIMEFVPNLDQLNKIPLTFVCDFMPDDGAINTEEANQ